MDGELDRHAPSPRSGGILPAVAYGAEFASLPPRSPRQDAAQDAAPVIRVTIGRVEVRAAAPPAQGAARPTQAPKARTLSLDDYLRQRNSGER